MAPPETSLARAANAAQVTLYTLDAGGQRVLGSAVDQGPGLSFANQSDVRADSQDPVFTLAADTGGKALLESNRPELLVADLAQDGRVISVRLALFAEMVKARAWTPATLRAVGGTRGIGVTFLEETFSAL